MRVEHVDFVSVSTRDLAHAISCYYPGSVSDPDANVPILHRHYAPRRRRGEG